MNLYISLRDNQRQLTIDGPLDLFDRLMIVLRADNEMLRSPAGISLPIVARPTSIEPPQPAHAIELEHERAAG